MSRVSNPSPALPARFSDLAPMLDALACDAVADISVPEDRCDPTFGPYGVLAGFIRAAANREGLVLEQGLRTILDHDGGFVLKPAGFRLPLIEAAIAAVRSNDSSTLKAVRLGARAHAPEHYTPDLLSISRHTGTAFLLELKRSTASYASKQLARLEEKMTAAALVTSDVLHADRSRTVVSGVEIAVVDCSDGDSREKVIGLSDLDGLMDCSGVAASLLYLRDRYAHAVQNALRARMHVKNDDDPDLGSRGTDPAGLPNRLQEHSAMDPSHAGVLVRFARKRRAVSGTRI